MGTSKGEGKKGKGKGKGKGACSWCHEMGHTKQECRELTKYKADKDADRVKDGLGPFVPKHRQQKPPVASLDKEGKEDDDEDDLGETPAGEINSQE